MFKLITIVLSFACSATFLLANDQLNYRYISANNVTIEKGSITVNGVSLTVVNSKDSEFSVAIIPFTFENTNFNSFKVGTLVNLEFDVFGKYITKLNSKN